MRGFERAERRYLRRQQKKKVLLGLRIVVAALFAFITLYADLKSNSSANTTFLRWNFLYRGPLDPPSEVVLVAVDEATFAEYGEPPIPRKVYADAFERLTNYSPKLLIVDYAFPPDSREAVSSKKMGEALAKLPAILGTGIVRDSDNSFLDVGNDPTITVGIKREVFLQFRHWDGIVFSLTSPLTPPEIPYEKVPFLPLFEEFLGVKLETPEHADIINFYGPPTTLARVTIKELEEDKTNSKYADLLNDKILIFGVQKSREAARLKGDDEQIRVAYSNELMYGAEIHATIAANLLRKEWIRSPSANTQVAVSFLVIFLIGVIELFLSVPLACLIVCSFIVVGVIGTHLLFVYWLLWIPFMPIIFLFSICSISLITPFRLFLSKRLHDLIDRRLMVGL